jgi:uncharacterized membrane protein YfcA
MESIQFIDLTATTALILFLVGFIGGMVSGFIGSGGAFVLTPAMMSLGAPAAVAVASNMAHKFPKALVGAYKRNKYGQVDIKLGVVVGIFAEAGVLIGKHFMVDIREAFGAAGTNLNVSFVFIVVLGIVDGFVLRDGLREKRGEVVEQKPKEQNAVVKWVRGLNIPGTMIYFKSMDCKVSFLVLAPVGFATGLLAATIAVGGFIGLAVTAAADWSGCCWATSRSVSSTKPPVPCWWSRGGKRGPSVQWTKAVAQTPGMEAGLVSCRRSWRTKWRPMAPPLAARCGHKDSKR